ISMKLAVAFMAKRASFIISVFMALGAFLGLVLCPGAATEGARSGLALCAGVIIPSLFPFMVMGNLFLELSLPQWLGRFTAPITKKLFGVSGAGSAAFFLGLIGGYPLGAITLADMYSRGLLKKKEAERLLGFCDNSGPAFIIAVAGSAVFGSAGIGFFLYTVHILAAVLVGILLRFRKTSFNFSPAPLAKRSFSQAFTESVKRAAFTSITVCGFVVFFSVMVGLLDSGGVLPAISGRLSAILGVPLHFTRALLTGLLEIGTGICTMTELLPNAAALALCAFVLGWGGLSVHAQAAAVISEGGLSPAWHLFGKLLHGVLSALITLLVYPIIF
ncbi:MAG: sporulation protein, partial [Oscillospiraceae bacterium]